MNPTSQATAAEQAPIDKLKSSGTSVAQWSRQNGFNPKLVYQVLSGNRKCLRGESFRVAKALDMKP